MCFKKINLLCGLVGLTGTLETIAAINNDDVSCFTWIEKHPKVPKLSRKSFEDWNGFIEWLKQQRIITICDFS